MVNDIIIYIFINLINIIFMNIYVCKLVYCFMKDFRDSLSVLILLTWLNSNYYDFIILKLLRIWCKKKLCMRNLLVPVPISNLLLMVISVSTYIPCCSKKIYGFYCRFWQEPLLAAPRTSYLSMVSLPREKLNISKLYITHQS